MTFVLSIAIMIVLNFVHVVLHELGHAIPAYLLTKQKVEVYIGSYGDKQYCIKISTHPIDCWIKINPLSWFKGLCKPTAKELNINAQLIYTAVAPLVSIVYIFFILYLWADFDPDGKLGIFPVILALGSITLMALNLLPVSRALKMDDGSVTYNDGYTIRILLRVKRIEKQYIQAFEYFNKADYKKSAQLFALIIKKQIMTIDVFRYALYAFVIQKKYDAADGLIKQAYQLNITEVTATDYQYTGTVKLHLEEYDEAIDKYKKALALQTGDYDNLNNLGYTYTLVGQFAKAIVLLDKAIELNPGGAFAYNNRGYAKIKTGDVEGGRADVAKSLELDGTNSYAYRNMGIYHMATGDYKQALSWLTKARKIDAATPMLKVLLKLTEDKLITKALAQ